MSLSDPAKLHSPLDGWVTIKLGEHASFKTGPFGTALHQSDYEDGGVPIINPTQIVKGKLLGTSSMAVSEKTAISLLAFRLSFGDIVIGRRGEMGRCALVNAEHDGFICGTDSMIIRVNSTLNASLLQRLLSSTQVVSTLEKTSDGLTMSSLNQKTLKSLSLTIPASIIEQDAIADALSDADAYIESLERLLAKKRDIKQGVMLALLSGKTRLSSFDKKLGFRTVEHLMVPADWKVVEAGTIGRFRGGSGFPVSYQGLTGGKIPFFKVSDMNSEGNETLLKVANNYLSEISQKRLGAKSFPANTVAFAKVGAAVFLERKRLLGQESCLDNNMAGFTLFDDTIDYRFIYHALLLVRLGSLVATTALPSLNNSVLNAIKLSVPPTKIEQQVISTILSDFDTELSELKLKRDKAAAVKQGMMQELLTGRTRLL